MSKITVFDNERTALWFHSETKIIHHQIKKYVSYPEFGDLLEQGYELMKNNGAQKWLSDDRNYGALTPEVTEWVKNDWFPRVVAAGWKYWAIVTPKATTEIINIRRCKEEYTKAEIVVNVFDNPDEALAWLENQ